MLRKTGSILTAAAIAVSIQVGFDVGSAHAAGVNYRLKNVATGKCLTAVMVAPLPTNLRMQTCGSTSAGQTQSFTPAGNYVEVGGTGTGFLVCLAVPKAASTDNAEIPVVHACTDTKYYKNLTYNGVGSGKIIVNGCHMGHYSSGDTWASCYASKGNYTKWNWVRA